MSEMADRNKEALLEVTSSIIYLYHLYHSLSTSLPTTLLTVLSLTHSFNYIYFIGINGETLSQKHLANITKP